MLLLMSCGGPRDNAGGVRHLFAQNGQDDKTPVIFAAKQPNGQHCFYGQHVAHEVSLESVAADKSVVRELAQGSALLTPRSLLHEDVRNAALVDTKKNNIISHLLFNPISLPLSTTCFFSSTIFLLGNVAAAIVTGHGGAALTMVTLGKVAAVSCGAEMALYAGAVFFNIGGVSTSSFTSKKLVSPSLHGTSTDELARLRKIFSWLESRDAMQCPATLQLPRPTRQEEK